MEGASCAAQRCWECSAGRCKASQEICSGESCTGIYEMHADGKTGGEGKTRSSAFCNAVLTTPACLHDETATVKQRGEQPNPFFRLSWVDFVRARSK